MKKQLLALFLALIMLISVLPATVLTVEAAEDPTYVDLTYADIGNTNGGNAFKVVDKYTVTLSDSVPYGNENKIDSVGLGKLFGAEETPFAVQHLSQTIKIDNMPLFTNPTFQGDYYKSSGYYNLLERNRILGSDNKYKADFIVYSIYRKDTAGNLGMKIFNPTMVGYYPQEVPLEKKLGDTFRLTTVWHEDNTVTFYCDGEELGTYNEVTFTWNAYYSLNCLMFGYFGAHAKKDGYDGTVNVSVSNLTANDGHIVDPDCSHDIVCSECNALVGAAQPAHVASEDDGDCTTDILCGNAGCKHVVTPGKDAHTRAADFDCTKDQYCTGCGSLISKAVGKHKESIINLKDPTATEKGYTGDIVCYTCNMEIDKGEEIPATGVVNTNQGNNSGNNGGMLAVYIVLAVVVLLGVAAVIILVVRKKRTQK